VKFPETVEWESTAACFYGCYHCGQDAGKPWEDELDTGEALGMFDELAASGVRRMIITGGEFTLRDDWLILLKRAIEVFELPQVVTNGSPGSGFAGAVKRIPGWERLLVSLSLDGTKAVHDARRGRGSFRRIKEILDDGLAGRVEVITVLARDNIGGILNLREFLSGYKLSGWRIQVALPLGRMKNNMLLSQAQIARIAGIIRGWARGGEGKPANITCDQWISGKMPESGAFECPAGSGSAVILADGSVTGCSLLRGRVFGNIRVESFQDIWYGKGMSALREMKAREGLTCRTCSDALRDSGFF